MAKKNGKIEKRPWGWWKKVAEGELISGERYWVKKITILPGHRISLQRHFHRNEFWIVQDGFGKLENAGKDEWLNPKDITFLKKRTYHRIENPSVLKELKILEIAIGEKVEERDIQRKSDDYNRK